MLKRAQFVEFDGLLAVVVALAGETVETVAGLEVIPENHVALWYGEPRTERESRGGKVGANPIVLTVPSEYCGPAPKPDLRH